MRPPTERIDMLKKFIAYAILANVAFEVYETVQDRRFYAKNKHLIRVPQPGDDEKIAAFVASQTKGR